MKRTLEFFDPLYALLLHLYPLGYQDEYGKELQLVFNLSLGDALKTGG